MDQTTPGSSETHNNQNNQINPETPTNPETSNTSEVPKNSTTVAEPDVG